MSGPASASATAAQWTPVAAGANTFRLRNEATGTYLANTAQGLGLAANTGTDTLWRFAVRNGHLRLRPEGSEDTLNVEDSPTNPKVSTVPDAYWSQDWIAKWSEMPSFATERLTHIKDWTKIDPTKDRDRILFAAKTLIDAPDNADSLALKERWAQQFPYDVTGGLDRNRGTNIKLRGEKLDSYSKAYDAQTDALYVTGFWAEPGEEITVIVPEAFVGQNVSVQIGFHDEERLQEGVDAKTQEIKYEAFGRFPFDLTVSRKVDDTLPFHTKGKTRRVTLRNGFGGVIMLAGGSGFDPDGAWISVGGGREMPVYDLGVTGASQVDHVRRKVAPWAALRSERLTALLPSEMIRDGVEIAGVTWGWDLVMEAQDALVDLGRHRKAPDTLKFDIVMPPGVGAWASKNHMVTAPVEWVEDYLQGGAVHKFWGLYHELGHNHQAPAWASVGGTLEVTVNIPVLYARHKLFGTDYAGTLEAWRPDMVVTVIGKLREHLARDPATRKDSWIGAKSSLDYDESQPEMKLAVFGLLSQKFGWDVFKNTFRAYQKPGFKLPADNDQARIETLMRELSRFTGHDLADYFALWGVPLDASVRAELAALRVGPNADQPLRPWSPQQGDDIAFEMPIKAAEGPEGTDGLYYKVRNLRLFGASGTPGGNVIWAARGGPRQIDLQFDPTCIDCERPNALVIGLKGVGSTGGMIWNGKQNTPVRSQITNSFWNNWTGTLDIPQGAGAYEVCVAHSAKESAADLLERQKRDAFATCKTVGLVIVDS